MHAAENAKRTVALFLIEAGADVNLEVKRQTALSHAIEYNDLALVERLLNAKIDLGKGRVPYYVTRALILQEARAAKMVIALVQAGLSPKAGSVGGSASFIALASTFRDKRCFRHQVLRS